MMTVRFPNGYSVQYNNAWHVRWGTQESPFHRLYDKSPDKGGDLIAAVPVAAIIEWVPPCRQYSEVDGITELRRQADILAKEIRSLKRKLGKK